ncbi:MAG: ABC transporter ATP-binding protein/permease [Actinomycetota bacterium]|nr:ABC transporter ATP-binding protein/permease [Actinomycetota bacterium]
MTTARPSTIPSVLEGQRRMLFARLLLNGLVQAGSAVVTATLVDLAFDRLLTGTPAPRGLLLSVGAGLAASTLCSSCLRAVERTDAERLGQGYVHEVRRTLFDHLVATAPRALQQRSQGGQIMRFVGDLTALQRWVSLGLARLAVATTITATTIMVLLVVNTQLAALVALALVLGALAALVQGRRLHQAVVDSRRQRSRLASNVTEKIASLAVVQAFGQTERERQRVDKQSLRLQQAMVAKARYVGRLRAIAEGTGGAAVVIVLLVSAAHGATPGSVAGALTIVGLLTPQLRDLGRVEEYRHSAKVAAQKLAEVLCRPVGVRHVTGAPPLQPGPGRLEFDGVSVDGGLHRIRAVAEPGQVVAVVGPNAAGKSTLLSVAARMLEPVEGRVRLDGQDLAHCGIESVRHAVGLAGPDLPLLRGTVEMNLRYRVPDAPDEELCTIRELCEVDQVLAELPAGAATKIGEGGKNLSAGQRQRIALARALLGSPRVLLLDEADAYLDVQAAAVIDQVVHRHPGTVLLVTHRLDRLAAADIIWYLRDGRLVEAGPPHKLLTGHGPTALLFDRDRVRVSGSPAPAAA